MLTVVIWWCLCCYLLIIHCNKLYKSFCFWWWNRNEKQKYNTDINICINKSGPFIHETEHVRYMQSYTISVRKNWFLVICFSWSCVVCNCKQKATSTNHFSTRKSMPRLLQNERERAVGVFQAGMTQTEIANRFNCSRMTKYRLLVRVRATGTTSDLRRCGRRSMFYLGLKRSMVNFF
jgi:hypothetical protein